MKKQLLTASVLLAFTVGTFAENDLRDNLTGNYNYSDAWTKFSPEIRNQNPNTQITNHQWNSTINLSEDARWEIAFTVNIAKGSNNLSQPLFNMYLAAPGNSILYGNYYLESGRGPAMVQHFAGKDASNADINIGSETFALSDFNIKDVPHSGLSPKMVDGRTITTLGSGWGTESGIYFYSIIIESFADASKQDLIMFTYDYTGDYASETATSVYGIRNTFGNIDPNRSLDVGCFVDNCYTGTVSLDNATFEKTTRTLVIPPPEPQPEPTPTPSVPEPSAFGLLAGIGALALVASRRRRK